MCVGVFAASNGFLAFFLGYVSFNTNKLTNALTMTVTGNVKQALSITIGIWYVLTPISCSHANKHTSQALLCIAHCAPRVCVRVCGWHRYFGVVVTYLNASGIIITLFGGALYSYVQYTSQTRVPA